MSNSKCDCDNSFTFLLVLLIFLINCSDTDSEKLNRIEDKLNTLEKSVTVNEK